MSRAAASATNADTRSHPKLYRADGAGDGERERRRDADQGAGEIHRRHGEAHREVHHHRQGGHRDQQDGLPPCAPPPERDDARGPHGQQQPQRLELTESDDEAQFVGDAPRVGPRNPEIGGHAARLREVGRQVRQPQHGHDARRDERGTDQPAARPVEGEQHRRRTARPTRRTGPRCCCAQSMIASPATVAIQPGSARHPRRRRCCARCAAARTSPPPRRARRARRDAPRARTRSGTARPRTSRRRSSRRGVPISRPASMTTAVAATPMTPPSARIASTLSPKIADQPFSSSAYSGGCGSHWGTSRHRSSKDCRASHHE